MSTKVSEICTGCGASVMPTDKVIAVESEYGSYPVRFWRYECSCGWKWANDLQRAHNFREESRQRKAFEWGSRFGG